MCGRYSLTAAIDVLAELLGLSRVRGSARPQITPRYNIAPLQDVPIVRSTDDEHRCRELAMVRWGLIPSWATEPDIGSRTINCRSETADAKPAFRESFLSRRCLVPADGFFEWKTLPDGSRRPMLVRVLSTTPGERRASSEPSRPAPFAMAGIWDRWQSRDRSPIDTVTILTTEANAFMRPIHDRMPVILRPADYEPWLAPLGAHDQSSISALKQMCRPIASELLVAHPVGALVNSPRHDDPRCVQAVADDATLF